MVADPLLPLSPAQGAALAARTTAVVAAWRPRAGSDRLPRIPEQLLVTLVQLLRGETEAKRSPGHARGRVRRRAALTGSLGPFGLVPTEVVQLVEQARAGVRIADGQDPERSDSEVAADLLVAWGLLTDAELAERVTAGTSEHSLLDELVLRGGEILRDHIPDRWTPWSTLRLLWEARQLPGLKQRFSVKGLRSRGLRAIPVLGAVPSAVGAHREMHAFQKRLDGRYAKRAPA